MKSYIYTVKNKLENRFALNVSTAPTDGAFVRSILASLKQSDEVPENFDIYCLGEYDIDLGVITALPEPRFVPYTAYKHIETPSKPITPDEFKKTANNVASHSGDRFPSDVPLSEIEKLDK